MKPLPIQMTVALGDGETPISLCSRNALLVGRSARDFCLDAGFSFQDVVDGKSAALEALADRCLADFSQLSAAATVKIADRRYAIRAENLTRDTLSRKMLRICPHCLAEDIEMGRGPEKTRPFGRLLWLIEPIRTCHKHGVALIPVSDDQHPHRVHDFAMLVQPALADLVQRTRDVPQRDWSPLEDYLARRLRQQAIEETPWLNALPLYAAAKACETLGAIAGRGIHFTADALSDADWHEAGTIGYEIAAEGEKGIRGLLTRLQESEPRRTGDWGPRSIYGRAYEWVAHESDDPAYDPLRSIIERHYIETRPVGPGDEIFRREITTRRLHSVRTASLETGAHPKRLRKLLHAAGHISSAALSLTDDDVVFDANEAQAFLARVADAMSLREAGEYLNAPRPHERLLFDHGFIKPFVLGGTGVLKDHAFARCDLDGFLERLRVGATELIPGEKDLLPIPAAAKKAACSAMQIVELVLGKKLARIRLRPGVSGYLSILLDPVEVKGLIYERKGNIVSLREVEKRLGSSTRVVSALIEHGYLPVSTVINPVTRLKQRIVPEDLLSNFMDRYVTLHSLAKEESIYFRKLADQFNADGIKPAFDPKSVHATFYQRDDVAVSVSRMTA